MAFKYKIKEAPAPNLANQIGAKVGDVTYSKDGDTRYTVDAVNPESGKVSWKVTNLPNFDKLFDDINDAAATAKGVYTKVKDDQKFRGFYEDIRQIRNKIRTHLRSEYPEDYKRMTMNEEDVDEASMSGAAGAYNTPYAFNKNKKEDGTDNDSAYTSIGYKAVKEKAENIIRKKFAKVPKAKKVTSKQKMKLPSGMVSSFGVTENKENPGATLGPGPAASEDGVKDNYYVKGFKYKLVPKNKQGTYVQKGSSMPVRKLWG
jgi:hypothetical protein